MSEKEDINRFPEEGLPLPGKLHEDVKLMNNQLAGLNNMIVELVNQKEMMEQRIKANLQARNEIFKSISTKCVDLITYAGYEVPKTHEPIYDSEKGTVKLVKKR